MGAESKFELEAMSFKVQATILFFVLKFYFSTANPIHEEGSVAKGYLINPDDCGSTGTLSYAVRVTGCECSSGLVCFCPVGTTIGVDIDFIPEYRLNELTAEVYGTIGFAEVEFLAVESNACSDSLPCPVNAKESQHYSATADLLYSYAPTGEAIMAEWRLFDPTRTENGYVVCFRYPVILSISIPSH